MKRLLVVALLAMSASLAQAQPQPRPLPPLTHVPDNVTAGFLYTATTDAPVSHSGQVTARGLTWTCGGTTCTIRGNWERPGIPACAALAQQVGHIASYGRPGVMLGPVQLRLCNAGLQGAATNPPSQPATPSTAAGLVITTSPIVAVGVPDATAAAPFTPVVITTSRIVVVGDPNAVATPPFSPVTITTATLRAEGASP